MKQDINNLGTYANIAAVWAAYPEGGQEGDYLYIGSTKYRWNKYDQIWENASTVTEGTARKLTELFADVAVNNDLRVGGTLYYHRLKGYDLGLYSTLASLQAEHPSPEVGMWAFVVHPSISGKYQVYQCSTAGEWTLSVSETTLDILDFERYEEAIALMQQIANGRALTGYRAAQSVSDLPTEDVDPTLGWIVGNHLYVWVGEGGDTLGGLYQNCGELRGEKGEKGDKGLDGIVLDPEAVTIDEKPTDGSDDLVKSGGVYSATKEVNNNVAVVERGITNAVFADSVLTETVNSSYAINANGVIVEQTGSSASNYKVTFYNEKLPRGTVIHFSGRSIGTATRTQVGGYVTTDPSAIGDLTTLTVNVLDYTSKTTSSYWDVDYMMPDDGWFIWYNFSTNWEGRMFTVCFPDSTRDEIDTLNRNVFGSDGKITHCAYIASNTLRSVSTTAPTEGFYLTSSSATTYIFDLSKYAGKNIQLKSKPSTSNNSAKGIRWALVSDYKNWPTSAAGVTESILERILRVYSTFSPTSANYGTYNISDIPVGPCYLMAQSLTGPDDASAPLVVIVKNNVQTGLQDVVEEHSATLNNLANNLSELENQPKEVLESKIVGGRLFLDNIYNKSIISSDAEDITSEFSFTDGYSVLTSGTSSESRYGTLSDANSNLAYSNLVSVEGAHSLYIRLPYRASTNSHGGLAFYDAFFTLQPSSAGNIEANSHYVGSKETTSASTPSNLNTAVYTIPIPEGAKYVATTWFSTSCIESYGTETKPAPFECKKITNTYSYIPKWEGESKTINVLLERGVISSSTGQNSNSGIVPYESYVRSALPIKCEGPMTLGFSIDGDIKIYKYEDNLTTFTVTEWTPVVANEAFSFDSDGKYIRFSFRKSSELEPIITIPKVVLQGGVVKTAYLPIPTTGVTQYYNQSGGVVCGTAFGFAVPVSVPNVNSEEEPYGLIDGIGVANPGEQDTGAVVPNPIDTTNITTIVYDSCILALPKNYSPDGDPVRLIVFCHGAGVAYELGDNSFNSNDIKPSYWLSEGYAIMDMDGRTYADDSSTTVPHMCMDEAMQCYIAGYQFVTSHFNVKKDGVFLAGRSMGGEMCFKVINSGKIPIIAACPHVPLGNLFLTIGSNNAATRRQFYAEYLGFTGTAPTWTSGTITEDEWNYYKDNFEKAVRLWPFVCMVNNSLMDGTVFMNNSFRTTSSSAPQAEVDLYKSLAIKTQVPIRISCGSTDPTCPPGRNARYLYWMLRNGGSYVEYHNYNSSRMTGTGTAHRFEIDPAFCATVTNSSGLTVYNVPTLYVEMLRFWRKWEQKGGY